MKNLLIYSITNLVNGKVYVGQTRQGLTRRQYEHISRFNLGERDHKLYQAMRKYGIENFKFEVLLHCFDTKYLDEMEVLFIKQFNSFNRGYNMTCGGDGVSDETIEKLRAVNLGRKITWTDKIVAARHRNGTYGKHTPKGDANPMAKSYLVRFPSGKEEKITGLRQFCIQNGLSHNLMIAVLNGAQRHHKGFSLLEGDGSSGLMVLAESLGAAEEKDGLPLRPRAPSGGVFQRAVNMSKLDRRSMTITNTGTNTATIPSKTNAASKITPVFPRLTTAPIMSLI